MPLLKNSHSRNVWLEQNQIPLGRTRTGEVVWKRFTPKSDSLLFAARPGIGKSVMLKNLYFFLFKNNRPLILFDPEGLDHRLSYFRNSNPYNLAPGVESEGMRENEFGRKAFYFTLSKNPLKHETKFTPALSDMGPEELRSLGFSPGAAKHFIRVLEEYGPFESFETLIDFLDKFPIRDDIADRYQRDMPHLKHHKDYNPHDIIISATKNNLTQAVYSMAQGGIFSLNRVDKFRFLDLIKKGHSIILSFDGHYSICRAVLGQIAREVIEWIKYLEDCGERSSFGQPWFVFEEMDGIIPRTPEENEKAIIETLSRLILRFRKLAIGMAGACPSLSSLNKKVAQGFHEYVFGRFAGTELNEIVSITHEVRIMPIINNLYWNRHARNGAGIREVLYVNELKQEYRIEPFESPCEIHREPVGEKAK